MLLRKNGYADNMAGSDFLRGDEKHAAAGMDLAVPEGMRIIDMHAHLWLGPHRKDACR